MRTRHEGSLLSMALRPQLQLGVDLKRLFDVFLADLHLSL